MTRIAYDPGYRDRRVGGRLGFPGRQSRTAEALVVLARGLITAVLFIVSLALASQP